MGERAREEVSRGTMRFSLARVRLGVKHPSSFVHCTSMDPNSSLI